MSDDSSLTDFFESDGDDAATPDAEGADADDAADRDDVAVQDETEVQDGDTEVQDGDASVQNGDAAVRGDDTAVQDGDARNDDAVEPATVTYEWSGDQTACEKCGDPTRRRWRDASEDGDAVVVCAECKDW